MGNINTRSANYDLEVLKIYQEIKVLCNYDRNVIDNLIRKNKQLYPTKNTLFIYKRVLSGLK